MEYIILDLEWNTAYSKSAHRFVNEIIEFGAVKTDGDFNVIGDFSRLVAPTVKKRLNGRVKELTHLTNEDIAGGEDFMSVSREFTGFAGDGVVMTWGTTDIHTLMENFLLFSGDKHIPFLHRYCDLQEYCERAAGCYDEGKQIGLGHYAEMIGVEFSEEEQHRAAADAYLSLKCLKKIKDGYPLGKCILQADCEDFYSRLTFKNHFITNLADPGVDREQLKFLCDQCGKPAQRLKKWKLHNKSFNTDFYCKSCGRRFSARVSFKKRYDSVKVNRKIIIPNEKTGVNRE